MDSDKHSVNSPLVSPAAERCLDKYAPTIAAPIPPLVANPKDHQPQYVERSQWLQTGFQTVIFLLLIMSSIYYFSGDAIRNLLRPKLTDISIQKEEKNESKEPLVVQLDEERVSAIPSLPLEETYKPEAQEIPKSKTIEQPTTFTLGELAKYSRPVKDLIGYYKGLDSGRMVFSMRTTGEQAARQLGYTRLFASTYDELLERTRLKLSRQRRAGIKDILADLLSIIHEEQEIDRLWSSHDEQAVSVAFLRALQNGDVTFPSPAKKAPIPEVLLVQLSNAYPEAEININDPNFALVYRFARKLVKSHLLTAKEIKIQDVIVAFRYSIIQSANTSRMAGEK